MYPARKKEERLDQVLGLGERVVTERIAGLREVECPRHEQRRQKEPLEEPLEDWAC